MRRTVALVGCSARKLACPAPAAQLYQGQLFKSSLRYAEAIGAEVRILSAQYGAVRPERVIEPYNLTLREMNPEERAWWYHEVQWQLAEDLGGVHEVRIRQEPDCVILMATEPGNLRLILLAGELYAPGGWTLECLELPLAGMGIGQQLRWLKEGAARGA